MLQLPSTLLLVSHFGQQPGATSKMLSASDARVRFDYVLMNPDRYGEVQTGSPLRLNVQGIHERNFILNSLSGSTTLYQTSNRLHLLWGAVSW